MTGERDDVFLEVSIGGEKRGLLEVHLFDHEAPRTTRNFRCLCTGECGVGRQTGKALHFKNSIFHRVIPGFMVQGGDFSHRNGTGGESIYGGKFKDEGFELRHCKAGLLSMANAGPNTNGSQFFITLAATPHLDGKHVVFGEVTRGLEVLNMMSSVETDSKDKPIVLETVEITDCGILTPFSKQDHKKSKKHKKEKKKKKEKKHKQNKMDEKEIAHSESSRKHSGGKRDRSRSHENDGRKRHRR